MYHLYNSQNDGCSEPDDAARWKTSLADAPALEFAPVDSHDGWRSLLGNLFGPLTGKNSQTHLSDSAA